MTAGTKMVLLIITVGAVVASYIVIMAAWSAIQSMMGIAQADPVFAGPTAGNYSFYQAAVKSAPWWFFFIPAVVGLLFVIKILRAKEG